jgi:hypothetical protein
MQKFTYIRLVTYSLLIVIFIFGAQPQRHFVELEIEPSHYPPAIDPLDTTQWLGMSETSLAQILKVARFNDARLVRAPYREIHNGVRQLLERAAPKYSGDIRVVKWRVQAPGFVERTYEIYLYLRDNDWVILDAATWETVHEA